MLAELTRKQKADSSLDLAGREGSLFVVLAQITGLSGKLMEHICNERVHGVHATLGDTFVGVDLLENLVDVGGVGLGALLAASGGGGLLGGHG